MTKKYDTLGLIFENPAAEGFQTAGPPMARIYLQTFTTGPATGFEKPLQSLTPMEPTADLFDLHADQLIDNIQRLKAEARRRFELAKRKKHS